MTKSQHECSCARSIVPPERASSHSCILNRIWFLIGQNLFDKFLSRLWTRSELFHYHLFPQKHIGLYQLWLLCVCITILVQLFSSIYIH